MECSFTPAIPKTGTYVSRSAKKDKEWRNMWNGPLSVVTCLEATEKYISYREWGVKSSLITMT